MSSSYLRKHERYNSIARARIKDINNPGTFIKDLSVTGGCIICEQKTNIKTGEHHAVEIIPEKTSGIGRFDLVVEFKWTHDMDDSVEIGFFILESPKGKLFQRYVDYLSWLSETHKNSGY